jgi:tRNA (guanine26-N2/guanine27-N2)-dimethyltransferase
VKLVEHVEGKTRLLVPAVSLTADPPPTSPVFFNPAASLNRDVSVALTAATEGSTFCDSMAGVGARGLRIANEVDRIERVAFVDFNASALRLARRAAILNGVERKCEFSNSETSAYLFSRSGRERRFDYVDVDPFGTPIGQIQGALSATSDAGLLSVTATDTAVLCGVYPKVAKRRYGGLPLNNHFNHETAVRLLVGSVARMAASLDLGLQPVAAHSTRHYVRLYLRVYAGASKADFALESLGYVAWCPACGHTEAVQDRSRTVCVRCGRKSKTAGPLWVGGLTDSHVLRSAAKVATRERLPSANEVLTALYGVDSFPPWSFSIERICSMLQVATVSESEVHRNLKDAGYKAMRTPFEKTGIKTDADFDDVVKAVKGSLPGARESGNRTLAKSHERQARSIRP